jgi:hypothetical protein
MSYRRRSGSRSYMTRWTRSADARRFARQVYHFCVRSKWFRKCIGMKTVRLAARMRAPRRIGRCRHPREEAQRHLWSSTNAKAGRQRGGGTFFVSRRASSKDPARRAHDSAQWRDGAAEELDVARLACRCRLLAIDPPFAIDGPFLRVLSAEKCLVDIFPLSSDLDPPTA